MIDLQKLHIFHIVAQEGSFSAAAERLYITQSAVSQQIKTLEAGLGQSLFERGWHGVRLTPSGEILANTARQIFELIAQAENALADVGQIAVGKISIGATPGIGIYIAPHWVQEFRTMYPKITVALNTGVTSAMVDEVLAHHLDFGIVEGELGDSLPTRLGVVVLDSVEQFVVVGFKHPLWDQQTVTLPELASYSFIMREQHSQSRLWLERMLRRGGIDPLIGAEFDNFEAMKRTVAAGTCMAVLPPYIVDSEVRQGLLHALPVDEKPFVRELKLIWDRETPLSPLARKFLVYLSGYYPHAVTLPDVFGGVG